MSASQSFHRAHGRAHDALRPVNLELDAMKYAEGSALIEVGDTKVLVSASVEPRVPPFRRERGGWLTAEYSMLPRATHTRSTRDVTKGRPSGRSSEIQRLIGRSLRAAVDLDALPEITVTIDCDVLQADGGTRTASITAAYVATVQALGKLFLTGDLPRWPILHQVAAISVGRVKGTALLDLDYAEDQEAEVDMNVVATAAGELVEVQGTGEGATFRRDELDRLLDLALAGVDELAAAQRSVLRPLLEEVETVRARGRRRAASPKDESSLWGPPA
ncbi:MAG: ribonuclease PH [Acidobacteria bacterium]|nr:ribonuclease PH [Acidobacteriota bacterium]